MKKILLSVAVALSFGSLAQQQRNCGVMQHELYLQQKNPNRAQERADYEKAIQNWIANNANAKTAQSTQMVVQIPLVVHMVYSSAADSVGDAQIFSQVQILNDDYTRMNADKVNTPSTFTAVASSPQINYCWAQRDPSGNPTTGIERRKSTTTSWTTDDKVKFFSSGGLDAWDPSRYFNIWVCALGGGLLGYGEFPTGSLSNTFGFVAVNTGFGNTGMATAPYNKGRTATHEIGHCFNLYHTFQGGCANQDACSDTPAESTALYGCPAYPKTDACTTVSPGVQFMNYMDYTDDACMNMFTIQQSARMTAVVSNPPYNALTTSNGCTPVTTVPLDAGITGINKPAGLSCVTTISPNVTLKNWGSSTLTSATIQYKIDGGALQSFSWSGSLASLATTTVALTSMTTVAGSHTFTANSTSPNGGVDGTPANDASSGTFTITSGVGAALPYFEGFESTTFPTNGITLINPDAATTWQRDTWAKKTGVASAYMDYFNYNASGQIDGMLLPSLNLTGGSNQTLTFQVAYQLYTSPTATATFSDTLAAFVSTNCGTSWTQIYKKFSTALTTATPAFSTTSFTPTAAQWRQESVSLVPYAASTNALIKFVATNNYENQMYLDDINITETTGIKNSVASIGVSIYPNPSADGKFVVNINQNESVSKLVVYDILGNKVFDIGQSIPAGQYDMDLSNLNSGTYFVSIIKGNVPAFTKIVISK